MKTRDRIKIIAKGNENEISSLNGPLGMSVTFKSCHAELDDHGLASFLGANVDGVR
jgi:hypothetical protein